MSGSWRIDGEAERTLGSEIGARLREWHDGRSYSDLARVVGMPAETVRRQMKSGRPSVLLVERLVERCGLNAHWLLTGEGMPTQREEQRRLLMQAPLGALLAAATRAVGAQQRAENGDDEGRGSGLDERTEA
ncbi:MAG: hypothetical protein ACTS3F_05420 [Phycisphaerales bacterium]